MAAAAALLDGRNADGSVSDFVFAVTLWGGFPPLSSVIMSLPLMKWTPLTTVALHSSETED